MESEAHRAETQAAIIREAERQAAVNRETKRQAAINREAERQAAIIREAERQAAVNRETEKQAADEQRRQDENERRRKLPAFKNARGNISKAETNKNVAERLRFERCDLTAGEEPSEQGASSKVRLLPRSAFKFVGGSGTLELADSMLMADLGVGPKVEDAFRCTDIDKFVIVYERLDGTLRTVRDECMPYAEGYPAILKPEKLVGALQACLALLRRANDAGFVPVDIHEGNFMFKKSGSGERWYVIDHGIVRRVPVGTPVSPRYGRPFRYMILCITCGVNPDELSHAVGLDSPFTESQERYIGGEIPLEEVTDRTIPFPQAYLQERAERLAKRAAAMRLPA